MEFSILTGGSNLQLVTALKDVLEKANTAHNMQSVLPKYEGYCQWAMYSVGILSQFITQGDIQNLITTPRHWAIVGATEVAGSGQNNVMYLLNTELSQRIQEIGRAVAEVQGEIDKWQNYGGRLIVPDTNLFLHEDLQFDKIDWRSRLGVLQFEDIHLVVPILVIKELDGNKKASRGITVSEKNVLPIRDRARQTLKKINELFTHPSIVRVIEGGDPINHGSVCISLLLDGVKHVALTNPDGEILDRALALQQAAGREVTIATRDISMSLSARNVGLKSILLFDEDCD